MEPEKKLLPWDKDSAFDFNSIMRYEYVNSAHGSVESFVYYLAWCALDDITEYLKTGEKFLLVMHTEDWVDLYEDWLIDNQPKTVFTDYAEIEQWLIDRYCPEYDDPTYVDCIYYGILDYTPAERLIEEIY